SSSISLGYFIWMSQPPDSGPPLLALEGCLSGAAFLRYDSLSGKARPRGAWAKTLEEAKPGHWDQQTELLLRILRFVGHLRAARSCWASKIKRFLVKTCIEQLKRYGSYANVTEPPVVTVSRKVNESVETLVCRVHGFYPREINATWRMNGMVQEHHTFAQVAPNADGTFYHRLSIDIDPQKRDQYRCHVNHMGLPETLAWEEPTGERWRDRSLAPGEFLGVGSFPQGRWGRPEDRTPWATAAPSSAISAS
uniref:Ig-like domain-containing protein n=1 Tax=Varanus komodoensis TaxID=61221 RepID=A0A8D2Q7N3_VARKO